MQPQKNIAGVRKPLEAACKLTMVSFPNEWCTTPVWKDPPPAPLLIGDQVHIWYWDFHSIRDFGASEPWLSRDEYTRLMRFKTEDSKRNFLGSHVFLRRVLSLYLGSEPSSIQFRSDSYGKPNLVASVKQHKLEFNLAHSQQRVLCAVAAGAQVGIDIERVDPDVYDESTAQLVFSDDELETLRRLEPMDRPQAFFCWWTRKEAYAKCLGVGLSVNLKGIELNFVGSVSNFRGVEVQTFYCEDDYIGGVAVMPPGSEYLFFKWNTQLG